MATIKEPRNLIEAIELSDASEWKMTMKKINKSPIVNDSWGLTPMSKEPQGYELQMSVSLEKRCERRGGLF